MKDIRTMNVDSWEYMKTMSSKSVDVIITDPMYGEEINSDQMGEIDRICKGHIIMFTAQETPFFVPDEIAYWIKSPSTKNFSKHLGRFVEPILIKRRGNTFNQGLHWSNYTGVYTDLILEKSVHPFQKPLSLLKRLVYIYSNPGEIVFDPFFGSGTTLIASAELDRIALGCEIDRKYYDAFLSRSK